MKHILTKYKFVNIFFILILLDIITTYICIAIGGLEYNPISAFFIKESMFIYILFRICICAMLYIIVECTKAMEKEINKIVIYIGNLYFTVIVFLNCIFILSKILGVI